MHLLNSRYARILTVVLLIEGMAFYAVAFRAEHVPQVAPLAAFPARIGTWSMKDDVKITVIATGFKDEHLQRREHSMGAAAAAISSARAISSYVPPPQIVELTFSSGPTNSNVVRV